MDLNSGTGGCVRPGGEVAPPLGVVKEEVTVLVVLVRRHCCALGASVTAAVCCVLICSRWPLRGSEALLFFSSGTGNLALSQPQGSWGAWETSLFTKELSGTWRRLLELIGEHARKNSLGTQAVHAIRSIVVASIGFIFLEGLEGRGRSPGA